MPLGAHTQRVAVRVTRGRQPAGRCRGHEGRQVRGGLEGRLLGGLVRQVGPDRRHRRRRPKVGDKVVASVPDGHTETHKVERVIVTRTDHDFVDLTIATSHPGRGPPATLTTTATHPFYDITQSAFVDAAHIKPGDELQQPDGTTATVQKVHRYTATQVTYDLTISGLHTYYVVAGTTPVLVHNCNVVLGQKATGTDRLAQSLRTGGRKVDDYVYAEDGTWQKPVMSAIRDPRVKLHINLPDRDFIGAAQRGLNNAGGATDMEMGWVARAVTNGERSWDSITWYKSNGDGFDAFSLPEPDWGQSFTRNMGPKRGPVTAPPRGFINDGDPYCSCGG
ncbi:polymorphic toxin-type HINT domain-containing protein [Spirillospora sp. NPDC047418]